MVASFGNDTVAAWDPRRLDPSDAENKQRPAQAIDLVHDHAIQFACLDRMDQSRESGAVHVGSGETAIVIDLRERDPPLAPLALNETRKTSRRRRFAVKSRKKRSTMFNHEALVGVKWM